MPNKFGKRDKFEVIPYPDIDFSPLNEISNGHTTNTQSDINQNGGIDTGNDLDLEPRGDHFRCGYFRWQPDWLQRCNNPRMLLAAICWFTFTQGFVCNGIVLVNLVPWERLFELRSRQTAWIVSMYDVTAAFFMLLFGYLGQHVHNGRILGIAALVMACGSFSMLLPHILSGPYELGPVPVQTCDLYNNATTMDCNTKESSGYFWFLLIGQALHGIGGSAVFTIAIPYLDTQIKSRDTPLYIGIMQGFSALGPAAGYMLGGVFLGFYVDYGRDVGKIDLDPSDPRWVGAWWIGLVFSSFASLTVAAIIACFPRELPSARLHKEDKSVDAYQNKQQINKESSGSFVSNAKSIVTNKVLVLMSLAGIVESGMVNAFGAFLPKLLQFQFGQSAVMAAVYTGAVIVPGAAGGHIIGGIIPKMCNFKMRGLLLQCAITAFLGGLLSFQVLLRCDTRAIAGITVPYGQSSVSQETTSIEHSCNQACNCTTYAYDPVCGQESVEYFSPCFAGCTQSTAIGDDKYFHDCSCIPLSNTSIFDLPDQHQIAKSGICEEECTVFYVFMFLFLIMCLCTFICATAGQAASLRAVTEKERSLSVGIQSSFYRVGNIPTPILFGLIFDQACMLWQESCDGQTGSCWIYDTLFVSRGLFIICLVVKILSCLAFTAAFIVYERRHGEEFAGTARHDSEKSLFNMVGDRLGRYEFESDSD